jgi:alpha-galactosidase
VSVLHLRAGGVSLVLDIQEGPEAPLPILLHWGPDLGDGAGGDALAEALVPAAANSAVDRPVRRRLLPMPADGWRLRPGLAGARAGGGGWSPRFLVRSVEAAEDGTAAVVEAADEEAGLALVTRMRLHPSGSWRPATPCATWAAPRTRLSSWRPACPCRPGPSRSST